MLGRAKNHPHKTKDMNIAIKEFEKWMKNDKNYLVILSTKFFVINQQTKHAIAIGRLTTQAFKIY